MSGILNKIKNMISPDRADQGADAIEKHATEERVDSTLNRAPGGDRIADKTPDDMNTRAADAVRDNLGDKDRPGN